MDMDRQDSLGPPPSDYGADDPATNKAGPSNFRAGKATPDKKGLLKPLSALRRSMSPAAMAAAYNGGMANAFTALMHGENPDKKWSDAAESEKAMVRSICLWAHGQMNKVDDLASLSAGQARVRATCAVLQNSRRHEDRGRCLQVWQNPRS